MNQNQTLDSDLQRAIDDITKTTSIDPVFSDPVAAPSSVPEGDDGVMGEAVGPFPTPEPIVPDMPAPEVAQMPEMPQMSEIPPMPELNMIPQVEAPVPPMPVAPTLPDLSNVVPVAPEVHEEPTFEQHDVVAEPRNMQQVRESALRDLVPILNKLTINPSQKFRIYRDMFEDLRDYTVLEPAYRAAHEIADEKERGEALLYLIEAIDRI